MNVIYASRGDWIYEFDFSNNIYYCETSLNALKKRKTWARPNVIKPKNFTILGKFTICKGPYRFRNLLKHLQLNYPELLI